MERETSNVAGAGNGYLIRTKPPVKKWEPVAHVGAGHLKAGGDGHQKAVVHEGRKTQPGVKNKPRREFPLEKDNLAEF